MRLSDEPHHNKDSCQPITKVHGWRLQKRKFETSMIRLNVFIQVSEDKRDEVLAIAKELVPPTLQEKGCIAYDIFESATRSDVLMFCETWEDQSTLDAHGQTPHFQTLVPKMRALATMTLEKFEF